MGVRLRDSGFWLLGQRPRSPRVLLQQVVVVAYESGLAEPGDHDIGY